MRNPPNQPIKPSLNRNALAINGRAPTKSVKKMFGNARQTACSSIGVFKEVTLLERLEQ